MENKQKEIEIPDIANIQFIDKYIDTFKMIVSFFGFLLISLLLILRIPASEQNILFYIGNGILFYIIYSIWNHFDTRKVFVKVKVPKDIVKPLQKLSRWYINGLLLITISYWIINQLSTGNSLFNLNEISNWIIIILIVLCAFKFIIKLLEAKLITHYIKIQSKMNVTEAMKDTTFMKKMKKDMQKQKLPKYKPPVGKKTKSKKKRKK